MTPPSGSFPRPPKPKAPSPAERSAELADVQRQLKQQAAERRLAAGQRADERPKRPTGRSRARG